MTKKKLYEELKEITQAYMWSPLMQDCSNDIVVTNDDIENFLDDYCIFKGNKKQFYDFCAGHIIEEFERRLSYFNCETKEAREFLIIAIKDYLLNDYSTMYKEDSLFSSTYDILCDRFNLTEIDDTYFAFNFDEATFDYEQYIKPYYFINEELEEIKKIVNNYINNL